jgi:uncharacterized protein (DUF1778 family)
MTPSPRRSEQLSVRLEPEVASLIARAAELERRPISSLARIVLSDWARAHEAQINPRVA